MTLASGVYDHIPGDGRERCVTDSAAVCVRAEDGRSIQSVDLRPFIGNLPLGRNTENFCTLDASGSTSQAAAIIEALEVGATALLIDEDTAATNFMIRDARMRQLVPSEQEPITPFVDRVTQLHETKNVSSILVVGGAGDYLDVAHTVIQMQAYLPHDMTQRAKEVARQMPLEAGSPAAPGPWPHADPRIPLGKGFNPRKGNRRERVRSVRTRTIQFGDEEIDVALVAQLVDPAQCRMLGDALLCLSRGLADGEQSVASLVATLDAIIEDEGLDGLSGEIRGDRARARRFEIAAAINRLRTLTLVARG